MQKVSWVDQSEDEPDLFDGVVDAAIDITADVCPMTYVRTRLALEKLSVGQVLAVRLRGKEPAENVPRSALDQGHDVLLIEVEPAGTTLIVIRRGE